MLGLSGRRSAPWVVVVSLCLLCAGSPSRAAPPVVYDSDFGGYVPIVDGIERPDLVAGADSGRVPARARDAERSTRRQLRRLGTTRGWTPARRLADEAGLDDGGKGSRWWRRGRAVVSDIVVLDPDDDPIPGARVFRYHDPSFYTVNESPGAARLFELRRYLPAPMPAYRALDLVRGMDPLWRSRGYVSVRPAPADFDLWHNPWRRPDPSPERPPVTMVGETDAAGTLRAISGVFNLRDAERFPAAVVPRSIRIGYVVVADGYQPGFSEARYDRGGVRDRRTIHLLRAPEHALLTSDAFRSALRLIDRRELEPGTSTESLKALVSEQLDRLVTALVRVAPEHRERASREAAARLYERLLRRATGGPLRTRLSELAWKQTPRQPGRALRYALELTASGERPGQVAELAEQVIRRAPHAVEAYRLRDRLLRASGADPLLRRENARRCLAANPFSPWARGRLATLELRAHRPIRAFDHLRYTFMTSPGLGGDGELARELADYYWRLGLPEKAGTFLWLLTGRPPEDPFVRVPRDGR